MALSERKSDMWKMLAQRQPAPPAQGRHSPPCHHQEAAGRPQQLLQRIHADAIQEAAQRLLRLQGAPCCAQPLGQVRSGGAHCLWGPWLAGRVLWEEDSGGNQKRKLPRWGKAEPLQPCHPSGQQLSGAQHLPWAPPQRRPASPTRRSSRHQAPRPGGARTAHGPCGQLSGCGERRCLSGPFTSRMEGDAACVLLLGPVCERDSTEQRFFARHFHRMGCDGPWEAVPSWFTMRKCFVHHMISGPTVVLDIW
ncbi:uncharacterized protein LOC118675676 [Myotis myotis]|uniref:uncharacterized protein LOC118675676 n=1 Tax=Myotis myotis TaxID=51298 RepID=UPI00174CB8CF|nr:uncharacterized protein LOC118675676 [Myotis myotis]